VVKDVVIEPMTKEFLLWRCFHGGPVSRITVDHWPIDSPISWELYRKRNVPLLARLTRIYGACAILARDHDLVVGHLRFYPKAVCAMKGAGGLCQQQDYPSGTDDDFADKDFPAPAQIEDKTIVVHCLMTGCPQQKENPYRRQGIGSRMVQALIQWAKANGWDRIEATSFEELPIIYENTGCAGHVFWEKLGFCMVDRHPHPDLKGHYEFIRKLEGQAKSLGIPPERARDRLVMRFDLQ
jgi:hypothetical protein